MTEWIKSAQLFAIPLAGGIFIGFLIWGAR
jgi:hypothetical protein